MNIVLAGMPGCGKTTVALEFVNLGRTVVDTDREIAKRYGKISKIFDKHGELYFRELESEAVERLSALDNCVISTGGGCLMRERNVNALKQNGKIVYLRAKIETLLKRIGNGSGRPLLYGGGRPALEKLYVARTPVFEWAADLIIDIDDLLPEQTAKKITEYFG